MWGSKDKKVSSQNNTPRVEKKLPPLREAQTVEKMDLSKLEKSNAAVTPGRDKPFFVEDDRKSKITVISLKSNRTSRTVQTMPSVKERSAETPAPKPKGAKRALKGVKDGFRESSIKRIIGAGLCVATMLLFLFGVFLPFWNVYTSEVSGVTTGYYGGLWNYCTRVTGIDGTECHMYTESTNEAWFRGVRFLELMSFMGMMALTTLVLAYMFCLRETKYIFLQWVIIGLAFGIGLFSFLGIVVFGACYSTSSHLSSAYGLTICAFIGTLITGALFLWDKIEMDKKAENDPNYLQFRGMSGARSSRMQMRRGVSAVRSSRSQALTHRSHGQSSIRSNQSRGGQSRGGQSRVQSIRLGGAESNQVKLSTPKEEA